MKAALQSVAIAVSVALLASACSGGGSDEKSDSDDALRVSTTTPAAKGTIAKVTWNNPRGAPTSLDPALAFTNQTAPIVSNMCESLLRSNPDGSYEPGIAEKVDNPDPRTYVFTLRAGVNFWDGSPVTADDVVFSLQRSATLATSGWKGTLANFVSATATDDKTVTVKLSKPNALFPKIVAGGPGVVISKAFTEKAGEKFGTSADTLMCSGPFQVGRYSAGTAITLKRVANYWDKDHAPKADQIDFKFITDPAALTQALQSGEVDGSFFLPYSSLKQLSTSSAGEVYYGPPNTNGNYFVFHSEKGTPLADPRIREALLDALDWNGVLDGIFGGAGELLRAPSGPSTWSYSKEIFQAAYDKLPDTKQDLDKAKALVKEAGAPTKTIGCVAPSEIQELGKLCLAVQAAGESIGLKVKVTNIPVTEYPSLTQAPNVAGRKKYDMMLVQLPVSIVDPLNVYTFETQTFNLSGYDNAAVSAALDKAYATTDDDARATLVVQAQAQLVKDLPWMPVIGVYQTLFMSNRVTGAALNVAQWYPWAVGLGSAS